MTPPSSHPAARNRTIPAGYLLGGAAGIALLGLYAEVLYSLIDWWISEKRWQLLIIPIACYMVFMERRSLMALKPSPAPRAGCAALFFATLLHVLARYTAHEVLQGLTIPVMVLGVVLGVHGYHLARKLFWPLLLLGMMTPLLTMRIQMLNYPLQIISANVAYGVLRVVGLEIAKDAHYLYLPGIALSVALSCSGFNQLLTLVTIAVPLGYLTQRTFRRQLALLALAVPLALLSNGVRVTLIALYNYWTPRPDQVHGPYEIFRTTFIPAFGMLLLFWAAWILSGPPRKEQATAATTPIHLYGATVAGARNRTRFLYVLLGMALVGNLLLLPVRLPRAQGTNVHQVPVGTRQWAEVPAHRQDTLDPGFSLVNWYLRQLEPAHKTLHRYAHENGAGMAVVTAVFTNQFPGNEMVNHTVENELREFILASSRARTLPDGTPYKDLTLTSSKGFVYRYWVTYRLGDRFYTERSAMRAKLLSGVFSASPRGGTIHVARLSHDLPTDAMEQEYLHLFRAIIQGGYPQ